jgi:hypothetical protein
VKYFHGGALGLRVGDLIRPAISLGIDHPRTPNQPRYNPRRVYITRIRWYAELFAAGKGDLYDCPAGRALPDLDAKGSPAPVPRRRSATPCADARTGSATLLVGDLR